MLENVKENIEESRDYIPCKLCMTEACYVLTKRSLMTAAPHQLLISQPQIPCLASLNDSKLVLKRIPRTADQP